MTIHTWIKNWQCWLLNDEFVPQRRMDELYRPCVEWKKLDIVRFSGSLSISASAYADVDRTVDQFLLFIRHDDDWSEGGWADMQLCPIEAHNPKWQPIDGVRTLTCDLAGQGGAAYFLGRFICQPDPSGDGTAIYLTGKVDDVIKELIRLSAVVGTAYDDPDGNPRGLAGLSVAANKTEHPDTIERYFRGNLWEQVKLLCLDNDIDLTFTPSWNGPDNAVTFTVDTHYQGRGADKTPGNPNPAVLSNDYQVFTSSDSHFNKLPHKTHLYTADGKNVLATNGYADRLRAEILVDTLIEDRLGEAAVDLRAEEGHNSGFRETHGLQVGRDIWIGDTVPSFDSILGTRVVEKRIAGFKFTIQGDAVGSEQIDILIGDDKRKSGGGQGKPQEKPLDGGDGGAASARFISGNDNIPVGPNAESVIRIYSATPGAAFAEDVDNNRIAFTAAWMRYDWGTTDYALKPTITGDDANILTSGDVLSIRLQADGKGWFDDDVVVGKTLTGANVTTALGKLHVIDDSRAFAGLVVDNDSGGQGEFSIITSNILTMRNWSVAGSLSFQVYDNYELAHGHGDGTTWSFRNGIDVIGYETADTSSVMWSLDGSNGNFYLDEDGTTTFGAYVHTWPLSGAVAGEVLTANTVVGSAIGLDWQPVSALVLHDELADVSADQHHVGFIGLTGDTGSAVPDGSDQILISGATPGTYTIAHDSQVDIYTPWTEMTPGTPTDAYLRQSTYGHDLRIQSAAGTDEVWIEGDTGKSHWGDDMYIGNAAGVEGVKLSIFDNRAFAGLHAWQDGVGYSKFGTITSGITVIDNEASASISFQCGGTEAMHIHGDLTLISLRNAVDLGGYSDAAGAVNKWYIWSDTGNLYLDPAATTTLGNYVITWPLTGADEDDVLTVGSITGSALTLAWQAPSLTHLGNGTAQYQVPMTGATPFTPAWTALSSMAGSGLTFSGGQFSVSSGTQSKWDDDGSYLQPTSNGRNIKITNSGGSATIIMSATLGLIVASAMSSLSGYQVNSSAPSGQFIRGNGSYGVFSTIQAGDLPDTYASDSVTITAGAGLTGGGDLSSNRTLNVGAGTGIVVNANDVAISDTGVASGTYGNSSSFATFTVNDQGQLTDANSYSLPADDLDRIGNGSAQWQVPVTGATPFTPAWTALSADVSAGGTAPLRSDSGSLQVLRMLVGVNAAVGADGDICASRSATRGAYYFGDNSNYIYYDGSQFNVTDDWIPQTDDAYDIGSATKGWRNGYYTGDLYVDTAGKGLIMSNNSDGKALVANGTRYVPATLVISGDTDDHTPSYNASVVDSQTKGAGSQLYYDTVTGLVGTSSGANKVAMFTKTADHSHAMSPGNAPITYT